MKNLEQIKNDYAVSKKCKNWNEFITLNLSAHEYHYNCIIEIVQKECLKLASERILKTEYFSKDVLSHIITNENNIIK